MREGLLRARRWRPSDRDVTESIVAAIDNRHDGRVDEPVRRMALPMTMTIKNEDELQRMEEAGRSWRSFTPESSGDRARRHHRGAR